MKTRQKSSSSDTGIWHSDIFPILDFPASEVALSEPVSRPLLHGKKGRRVFARVEAGLRALIIAAQDTTATSGRLHGVVLWTLNYICVTPDTVSRAMAMMAARGQLSSQLNLDELLERFDKLRIDCRGAPVQDVVVPLRVPAAPFELAQLEGRAFVRARDVQTELLVGLFEARVFGKLAVPVKWSKRLNTTAGTTKLMRLGSARTATIELATKVVDTTAKLINTLCHEVSIRGTAT